MIRRPPRSTQSRSSAASDVYKRQASHRRLDGRPGPRALATCAVPLRLSAPPSSAVPAGHPGGGAGPGTFPRDLGESSRSAAATSARSRSGGTSASMNPRDHLASARYSSENGLPPAGRVREPEKLTLAPGTPKTRSAPATRDAQTPPVVGSPATATYGM